VVARDTQSQAKSQGGLQGLSPLRLDGSCGSQAGRLDCMSHDQRRSNESWKIILVIKTGKEIAQQKESTNSFSGAVEEVRC
jgi:hypothetical protein